MVLNRYGNSEIGAHVRSDLGYLSHKSDFCLSSLSVFLRTCVTCSELPYNLSTMAEQTSSPNQSIRIVL